MICAYFHTSAGSWLEWYYGNFHGVFKTPDDSGDESSNEDSAPSKRLRCPSPITDEVHLEETDAPFQLQPPSKPLASSIPRTTSDTFQNTQADVHASGVVDFIETKVEAIAVHEDLRQRAENIRFRKEQNMKQREEEQECIRQDAAARWQSGSFCPTFGPSPPTGSVAAAAAVVNVLKEFSEVNTCDHHDQISDAQCMREDTDFAGDLDHFSQLSSDGETFNLSGIEAHDLSKVSIELSTMSAEDIWSLFINSKLRGGVLARTLFITAKAVEPTICIPWCGTTKLESKKKEIADQRSSFLMWANSAKYVLQWIQMEIYKIIMMKPQTYKNLNATHQYAPKFISSDAKSGPTLQSVQASDDTMARVAHLACHPESRVTLNMIFGTKSIEQLDCHDLQPAALWQDLATYFVNSASWEVQQMPVLQLQSLASGDQNRFVSKIDVSKVPVIGVTGECVREVFTQLKKMFSDLGAAVFSSKTGVNAVGEDFYGKVWSNYINGPYLHFPRKEIAMYVFKLWNETNCTDGLPKYCIKELHPEAQIRLGVFKENTQRGFVLPVTPRGSSASFVFGSPGSHTSTTTTTAATIQESISSYISFKMKKEQENDAIKVPAFEAPTPDSELSSLLCDYDLLSAWDSSVAFVFFDNLSDL